ncbi:MAG: pantetheine-phosphate adenylyltransferase [Armatimonadetes bacterium]|nr:pantetheine-phosphate adenylyltransferase [Armatimonadota bacterium]
MQKLAIYPGSFDPPTLGHLDIIERASRMFDQIIVAIGRNSQKEGFLPIDARIDALQRSVAHLTNVKVDAFEGLLVDYAREQGAKSLIRGLRAISDFEYEFQIAMMNRKLAEEIDTVFLMTRWDYSFLSSSIVREIAQYSADYEQFVPKPVYEIIRKHYKS